MTHTAGPGPWKAIYEHDSLHADGNHIAGVQDARGNWVVRYDDDYGTGPELGPNTRLIAAAPDLLAELEECVKGLEVLERAHALTPWAAERIQFARRTIAAARCAELPA